MENNKLSIVMVGHVDHGKSTLIGRLLYDTGSVSEDKIEELRKASLSTDNKLEFAFLLDHLREERENGITIEMTQTFFRTEKRQYQIIDAPGHVEFVQNMVTGAAQADAAVLIVDASEGVMPQTRRHVFILSLLGIRQLIVVVNKMDQVEYSQKRFDEIIDGIKEIFKKLNMRGSHFVPVSALEGDNVCLQSKNMDWYTGDSLLEFMESIEIGKNQEDLPYLFLVQDVYKYAKKRIAVGRLEKGILRPNDVVQVVQTGQSTQVASIEKFMENPEHAEAGECIGITIKDALFLERGNVLCHKDAKIEMKEEFEAGMLWMSRQPVSVGEKLKIRCGAQETSCIIKEIKQKLNTGELTRQQENIEQLENLDAGRIVIRTKKPLAVTTFSHYECIGRFVILREEIICAGGIVL